MKFLRTAVLSISTIALLCLNSSREIGASTEKIIVMNENFDTETQSVEMKQIVYVPPTEVVEIETITRNNTILVGDSRTVGMEKTGIINSNYTVIAKVGEGYEYLNSNRDNILNKCYNTNLVINLGVNDLGNINKYIEEYEVLSSSIDDKSHIYLVSVNPVEEYETVSNEQITYFNSVIQQYCNEKDNVTYIDTYSTIVERDGFTTDGLHYTSDTYKDIYNIITEFIADYQEK